MRRLRGISFILGTLLVGGTLALAGCASPSPLPESPALPAAPSRTPSFPSASPLVASPATRTPPVPPPMSTPVGGWPSIDLPADATQLEYGAEIYRLVCRDCHGDRGQGLTSEFRATWAPADQNCWQSKCHAANHPPEGFLLPVAPPIVGPATLAKFRTAADMQRYIHAEMPWYAPGGLSPKYAWSVTAFVLKMNQIDPGIQLNEDTASQMLLR